MTVITITLPREEDARALLKLAREMGATEVSVREEENAPTELAKRQAYFRSLAYRASMTPEEEAVTRRAVLAGTDGVGIKDVIRWHEEDREDRPMPGRD